MHSMGRGEDGEPMHCVPSLAATMVMLRAEHLSASGLPAPSQDDQAGSKFSRRKIPATAACSGVPRSLPNCCRPGRKPRREAARTGISVVEHSVGTGHRDGARQPRQQQRLANPERLTAPQHWPKLPGRRKNALVLLAGRLFGGSRSRTAGRLKAYVCTDVARRLRAVSRTRIPDLHARANDRRCGMHGQASTASAGSPANLLRPRRHRSFQTRCHARAFHCRNTRPLRRRQ